MSQSGEKLPTAIREAAERLLAQRAPGGFTMDELAQEAGVGRATLYRQVGSRDALLAALSRDGVPVEPLPDVRDRILAACRVVFTQAGFDAATVEEVAAEAGVGPATVYRHFRDKERLVRAFTDRFGPRRAMLEVALHPSGDLRVDLERAAATVLRAAAEDLDLLKLTMLERLKGGPWADLLDKSPLRANKTLARLLKFYVARGDLPCEDPRRMAQAFAGMLLSFVTLPLLERTPMPDPDTTASFITRLFLDGLAPGRRRP